jgi:hypothetical protein
MSDAWGEIKALVVSGLEPLPITGILSFKGLKTEILAVAMVESFDVSEVHCRH